MIEKLVAIGHKTICVDIELAPIVELGKIADYYEDRVDIILVMNSKDMKQVDIMKRLTDNYE
jgi:hypothetical protein